MLTAEEFRNNLRFLSFLSKAYFFPLKINVAKGEIQLESCRRKRLVVHFLYALTCVHVLYVDLKLVSSVLSYDTPHHHIILHFVIALITTGISWWYPILFVSYPDIINAIFNGVTSDTAVEGKRNFHQYTRQQLIAIYFPYIFLGSAFILMLAYTYEPNLASLLFSSIPDKHRSILLFLVLLTEECRFILFFGSISSMLVYQLHVLFFEQVMETLERVRKLTSSFHGDLKDLKVLRQIHLLVSLFNQANCYIIFSFKNICLTACSVSGYSAIRHFENNPLFGLMYYAIFTDLAVAYSVLYEKGFAVVGEVKDTKRAVLHRVNESRQDVMLKRVNRMRIRSVPNVGIQVGTFHILERVSTPNFIGFILQSVVGLLVLLR